MVRESGVSLSNRNSLPETIHPSPFTIELNVNRHNPAVGFYKHMGFHEHATRDFHIGNGYYMNDYIYYMNDYIMRMEVKE